MKQVLSKVFSLVTTALVVLAIFLAYGSINNRWYRVITITGNSMAPTLWYGDLMVVTPAPAEVEPDTIVLMNIDGGMVTHRLLGYDEAHRPITKGDANETVDVFENPNLQIVGVCRLRLPGLGYPLIALNNLLHRS